MSWGIERGEFTMNAKPPNIERPRGVEAFAPGYARVHREAVERIRTLTLEDLDRTIPFFTGPTTIRDILWNAILAHGIHHRGQLSLMCRLAGGQTPGMYGPNREETGDARERRGFVRPRNLMPSSSGGRSLPHDPNPAAANADLSVEGDDVDSQYVVARRELMKLPREIEGHVTALFFSEEGHVG
jgi:DinB family